MSVAKQTQQTKQTRTGKKQPNVAPSEMDGPKPKRKRRTRLEMMLAEAQKEQQNKLEAQQAVVGGAGSLSNTFADLTQRAADNNDNNNDTNEGPQQTPEEQRAFEEAAKKEADRLAKLQADREERAAVQRRIYNHARQMVEQEQLKKDKEKLDIESLKKQLAENMEVERRKRNNEIQRKWRQANPDKVKAHSERAKLRNALRRPPPLKNGNVAPHQQPEQLALAGGGGQQQQQQQHQPGDGQSEGAGADAEQRLLSKLNEMGLLVKPTGKAKAKGKGKAKGKAKAPTKRTKRADSAQRVDSESESEEDSAAEGDESTSEEEESSGSLGSSDESSQSASGDESESSDSE